MPSTAKSSPSSRSISRAAHDVGPSSTACTRWRAPSATRWSPCPRVSGRTSPAGCPNAPRRRSRRPCRGSTPEGRPPFRTPSDRRQRRRRNAVTTLGALAVAAAAVAVVLGIGLVRADNRVSGLQAAAAAHHGSPVAAALRTPGHRLVDARHDVAYAAGAVRGRARRAGLPGLVEPPSAAAATRRTSCGGSWDSQAISLGLLGGAPRQAAFTMAGANRPSRLSITAEPAGRFGHPHRPDRGHGDCLTPAGSC